MSMFTWMQDAVDGGAMPDGLPPEEVTLFLRIRLIYRSNLTKEEARKESLKCLDLYRQEQFQNKCLNSYVDVIKRTETAASEYRKDRTLENADKLIQALEGRT